MNVDISKLSAAELDELIAKAAERRASFTDKHPDSPPDSIRIFIDPPWRILK